MKSIFAVLLCLLPLGGLFSQTSPPSNSSIEAYKGECRQLVQFVEFIFNTLGAPETTAREKETIIQQSYLKVFRDSAVQVEDDLQESRSTVTNKDVQAYLKDIDFFFKNASFEFLIDEITHELNDSGKVYFKVAMTRRISAITVDGDSLNTLQPRFIEINLNEEARLLKIASIYTTKLSEQESLANWWNEMPLSWKEIFETQVYLLPDISMQDIRYYHDTLKIGDTLFDFQTANTSSAHNDSLNSDLSFLIKDPESVPSDTLLITSELLFNHLKHIRDQESLDLSAYSELEELGPISQMTNLKSVNLAGTKIRDLVPLRNLTRLEELDITKTRITDLSPLRYAHALQRLTLERTFVKDLTPITNFSKLQYLNLDYSQVSELGPISALTNLQELRMENVRAGDLSPASSLIHLQKLYLRDSRVTSLTPLSGLQNLKSLFIDHTNVRDLGPLMDCPNLEFIFAAASQVQSLEPLEHIETINEVNCDGCPLEESEVLRFRSKRPDVLVLYQTEGLLVWWEEMDSEWQSFLKNEIGIKDDPGPDELQHMANLTHIDLTEHTEITSLAAISKLLQTKTLIASGTQIQDLGPIQNLTDLENLDIQSTAVSDLNPLKALKGLKALDCTYTQVQDLEPLFELQELESLNLGHTQVRKLLALANLKKLKTIYCDGAPVSDAAARAFLAKRPEALVVYRTDVLNKWWEQLPQVWKEVFRAASEMDIQPSSEQLHQATSLFEMDLSERQEIQDLSPLKMCLQIRKLDMVHCRISNLEPLKELSTLEELSFGRNPISNLGPLSSLPRLVSLNFEDTPIEDLTPLSKLINLEHLVCSGTQVRDLSPLANLKNLAQLDCSSTEIRSLRAIESIQSLKQLSCYNTRLTSRKVDDFKRKRSSVDVIFY